MPERDVEIELPSTLRRSPKEAQDTFLATLRSAIEEYGEGERARRTAYASLKHSFEKVGDHWEPKERPGPSDDAAAGEPDGATFGGVDVRATRAHLVELAHRLDVHVTTRMTKAEIARALEKESDRRSARARGR
ncbi:MAG: ChaB family protein [Candidatus Nanopelagicales bacterium]